MSIMPNPDIVKPVNIQGLDRNLLQDMYYRMALAREFEEKLYYLFLTRPMPGTMHQATGQEAVAVGVIQALHSDDYVTSTHRGHCHSIAKGVPVNEMMAEMFAKRTGSCKGMGGSMHLADFEKGMLGAFAIVGAGIPIATGAALSSHVRKSGQIAVAFFGDGAMNEGVFHESLNMAGLWKLPVLYVCENNQYALSMRVEASSANPDLYQRGAPYGIPGIRVDGNNVVAVYTATLQSAERARRGEGPTLLECVTYRIRGHARFEASSYRDPKESEVWQKLDPIKRLGEAMLNAGMTTEATLNEIKARVEDEVETAIRFAEASEDVMPEDYKAYITEESRHDQANYV